MEKKGYIAYCGTPIFWLGAAGLRGFDKVQNFYALRKECLDSGKLFEDPEFPPTANNWRRPKEFCDNPKFIVDGISRFDVGQGGVGDCWFVSALATLTTHDFKLDTVLCDDNSYDENYAGIFHFRFFQYGKWVDVVIDDRLPIQGYGQLVSIRSKQANEFWSALLEKAYAKLHGSYEALEGGTSHEALEDLTAGIPEPISLKNPPEDLYEIMLKTCGKRALLGCAPKDDQHLSNILKSLGLVQGHAYSITCVKEIQISNNQKLPMVRLRNPWGSGEWKGPWSDNSPEWKSISEEERKTLGLTHETDGEFWMRYDDFLKYFGTLNICNLTTHTLETKSGEYLIYVREDFNGEWIQGKTAGGSLGTETFKLNPQYTLTVDETENSKKIGNCTVLIELLQKNRRRLTGGSNFIYPGIVIYELKENQRTPLNDDTFFYTYSVYQTKSFTNTRAITVRIKLKPGKYVIIPCTYSPVDAEFVLRVYTETDWKNDPNKPGKKHEEHKQFDSLTKCTLLDVKEIEKIFKDVAGSEQEIGWEKLKKILDSTIPKEYREAYQKSAYRNDGFSKDICRSIIALFDLDHSRKINFEEFRTFYDEYTLWKSAFATYDVDLDHTLSSSEFLLALYNNDLVVVDEVIERLMYRHGMDNDKMLFEDFIFCTLKLKKVIKCISDLATKDYGYKVTFTLNNWLKTLYFT